MYCGLLQCYVVGICHFQSLDAIYLDLIGTSTVRTILLYRGIR